MIVDEGLEVLSEEECQRLLMTRSLGRIGVSMRALPAIFPVNYVVVDGDIYVRTGSGVKQRAALDHTVVAFEVDDADEDRREGWSVLVVGTAEEVPAVEAPFEPTTGPDPWAGGDRQHLVCIHPEFVSGRRIASTGPGANI